MARRIAVFSDIHGNLHALEAVLKDIERQGTKEIVCLGDLVGYGASPNEVVALVRERKIPCVRGNYDNGVGFDKEDCGCGYTDARTKELGDRSFQWSKEAITPENKSFLASLPSELRWEVEGWNVLLVHGSPRRINEYLFPDRSLESFRRIARTARADAILFGHTHGPFHKVVETVHFINVGTAGKPVDGDARVGYALVTFEPRGVGEGSGAAASPEDLAHGIEVEFRKVEYDVEAAAKAIESSGLPREFAALLRTGGASKET